MSRWAVVIPTNRPERFFDWRDAWAPLLRKHVGDVYVCEDLDEADHDIGSHRLCGGGGSVGVHVLERKDWPWWVPRGTDMCRSWGMVHAYRSGAEFILSLDDDTEPIGDVFAAYERVFDAGAVCSPYLDVGALTSFDGQMRGFPYADRERRPVGLQVGGWSGVLDFDARTQLELDPARRDVFSSTVIAVPKGAAVTVCAMNMAWRREYTPLMWQLPLLEGRYNRWGDIWAGLLAKRVFDSLNVAVVVNGMASVRHERASDPHVNLEREAPGVPANEYLWGYLRGYNDPGCSMVEHYRTVMGRLAKALGTPAMAFDRDDPDPQYADHLLDCRDAWLAELDAD